MNALVKVFEQWYHRKDVLAMMLKVNGEFANATKGSTQCPEPMVTLRKDIRLGSFGPNV